MSPAVSAATSISIGTPPPAARPVVTPAASPKQSRPGARPQPSAKPVRSAQPARLSPTETVVSTKTAKQEERQQEQDQQRAKREQKMLQRRGKKTGQLSASPTSRVAPQQPAPGATPAIPERQTPPRRTRRHPIKDQTGKTGRMNEKPRLVPDPTLPFPWAKPTLTKLTLRVFLPVLARPGMKGRGMPNESRSPTSGHRQAYRSRPASCRAGSL